MCNACYKQTTIKFSPKQSQKQLKIKMHYSLNNIFFLQKIVNSKKKQYQLIKSISMINKSKISKTNTLKNNNNIKKLSDNLFTKLSNLQTNHFPSQPPLQTSSIQSTPLSNPFQLLLDKANQTTKTLAHLHQPPKISRDQDINTFLTATGIYESPLSLKSLQSTQPPQTISHQDILKQLMTQNRPDDLEQLRRMLKETGQNIEDCKKKVYQTQKTLVSYVNTLNLQKVAQKKINSMNKIINKLKS